MSSPGAFVYLLRCADGSLYCGWTNDLERRLAAHRAGSASRYTRSRLPVELIWSRALATRSEAMREEARIKRLPRADKLRLALTHAPPAATDEGGRQGPSGADGPGRRLPPSTGSSAG